MMVRMSGSGTVQSVRLEVRAVRGRATIRVGRSGMLWGMKEVSPTEGQQMVQDGAVLVDVREPNEYDELHAEGALLLPLSELEARYAELPKDKPLLMICRSGARSARAGDFLLQNGYGDVTNLAGGTLAWNEAGLPVVRGS